MRRETRPYLYYDLAVSICPTCYRKCEGKILFMDGKVILSRRCPEHGNSKAMIADDIEYYRRSRERYMKPPERPQRYGTPVRYGCPYDCGLCADHEQHSCVAILEVTDACNLRCPICYAHSGPERTGFRSLAQLEGMLDALVAAEGQPDVLQVSGGEPTLHPQFFEILDAARARPIRHLMVNTNGIRVANDADFTQRLAGYMPGVELYLQFDSLESGPIKALRGADLRGVHEQALARCNELGLSVTLVCTLKLGLNDHEIGGIIDYALQQPAVRGVTFQPIQAAGRLEGFDPERDRLTLTGVRRRILEQTDVFQAADVIPVPCHPDSLAMAYALKVDGRVQPLTGLIPEEVLLDSSSTITFEREAAVADHVYGLFSTAHSPTSSAATLRDLLCCLPGVDAPHLAYDNLFRVVIMAFHDAYSFDLRSVKKSCVHIIHPDGRLIPFDTYNLFYRDELEQSVLAPLQRSQGR